MMGEELPDESEIREWARGVTPDGAPGRLSAMMREFLGDQRYEEEVDRYNKVADITLERGQAVNNLLSVSTALVSLYGIVGLVFLVSALIKYLF